MSAQASRPSLVPALFRGVLWGLSIALVGTLVWLAMGRSESKPQEAPPELYGLPPFELVERSGETWSLDRLAGETWVASFIFTRCAGPCPRMSQRMAALGVDLPAGVRRVSVSVDPEYDTPEILEEYAQRWQAPPDWLFLTGDRQEIWDLAVDGFRLGTGSAEGVENAHGMVLHSTRFVLVDPAGRIRGYYDPFEKGELGRLVAEAEVVASSG